MAGPNGPEPLFIDAVADDPIFSEPLFTIDLPPDPGGFGLCLLYFQQYSGSIDSTFWVHPRLVLGGSPGFQGLSAFDGLFCSTEWRSPRSRSSPPRDPSGSSLPSRDGEGPLCSGQRSSDSRPSGFFLDRPESFGFQWMSASPSSAGLRPF